jgi:hypothetical protein
MPNFSDYIVYVDESGDHGLHSIDPNYPVFVLAFCVFSKDVYTTSIVPSITNLKFRYFGHDMVIFHEHDIRKRAGQFYRMNEEQRVELLHSISETIETTEFTVIAVVIDKARLNHIYVEPTNPYHISLKFGLERVYDYLKRLGQHRTKTAFVFESRGKKEDQELELEFRRVCDGQNFRGDHFPFEVIFAPKSVNSTGLQFADMIARPIGLKVLRPRQSNHAYEVIQKKLDRGANGNIEGFGVKVFPK